MDRDSETGQQAAPPPGGKASKFLLWKELIKKKQSHKGT